MGIGVCAVMLKVVVRSWDVELVDEEKQEVALTFSLLHEWPMLGLGGRSFFQVYDCYELYDVLRSLFD